jgi:tRNA A37 methylthiotransferase MiaB
MIEDIMAECRSLAAQGVKEITFLGQIVTSFGRRTIPMRDGKSPFVQLLEAANEIEGLERIRFTSPHPKGTVTTWSRLTHGSRSSLKVRTYQCKAAATGCSN